ncbi:MAG: hypothetical protein A2Y10_16895 [Planctomycetes bacterium GWF2_41_51]|nr:MAG: hypothetical protein A2Y10_16895 [Planctomycetes bacterium GWF2_41_51]HBG28092.1 hypothetical protein [Phycisphaerales bacterium]
MKRRIMMLLVLLAVAGIVEASLVCHYKFDGDLVDSSANAYPAGDGTLIGDTQYVTGKFGQALEFDGLQDFVQLMVAPNGSGGWYPLYRLNQPKVSYAMWVWMDAYPTADTDILAGRYWWPGDSNIEFHQYGFGYQMPFYIVAQQPGTLSEYAHNHIPSELLGQWFHLAITYDVNDIGEGGKAYMYINGVPGDVAPLTSMSWVHIGNYTLGGNAGMDGRWFDGKIDELYIYNQVLTAADIATLMTGVDAPETPGRAVCGDAGRFAGDVNGDCVVDFIDFAVMAEQWLKCSDMSQEGCVVPHYSELQGYPYYEPRN